MNVTVERYIQWENFIDLYYDFIRRVITNRKMEINMNWKEKKEQNPKVVNALCDCSPEEIDYDSGRLEVLNQHLQSLIEEGKILSGSYCLWRHGKVFADAALGSLACPWQGRSAFLPDTLFEIQSVTKVFTATAILKLAEEGMLYLGQPVCEWVKEFSKDDFRNITIAHLLTHTSGLCALPGVYPQDERIWWNYMDENRVKETWIPAIVGTGLHAKPGEEWIYSAVGYPLLGEIIERATGIRAETFIREEILLPCDMMESHWREDATEEWVRRYNIANTWDLNAVKEYKEKGLEAFARPTYLWWEEVPETSAGVMSTCREMVHFGEMMLRGGNYRGRRVLGKKALSWFWKNLVGEGVKDYCFSHPGIPVTYGAGMPIFTRKNDFQQLISEQVVYHEGSGASVFLVDREEDFVVMFQTSFHDEKDWCWEAVKGTASIIWSGLR